MGLVQRNELGMHGGKVEWRLHQQGGEMTSELIQGGLVCPSGGAGIIPCLAGHPVPNIHPAKSDLTGWVWLCRPCVDDYTVLFAGEVQSS